MSATPSIFESLASIFVVEPVKSRLSIFCIPVTTTSSIERESGFIRIRRFCPALISVVTYPTEVTSNVEPLRLVEKENFPSMSVTARADFCPFILTTAPIMGSLSSSETTVPETIVCAITVPNDRSRRVKIIVSLFSINSLCLFYIIYLYNSILSIAKWYKKKEFVFLLSLSIHHSFHEFLVS